MKNCDRQRVNCLLLISLIAFIYILPFSASAQTMSNGAYKIEEGNLNSFSGRASNSQTNITFTSGQSAPGFYKGTNYTLQSGFQYLNNSNAFSFSISNNSINFDELKPGEPITRTNTLTIDPGSQSGYQVIASEDHELKATPSGAFIPDTTCDKGNCTEATSATWSSPLTYGFGYRCDNLLSLDCNIDFTDQTYYKHFSNLSKNQQSVVIMSNNKTPAKAKSQTTYKLNIAGTQPAGIYQNTIIYIATPSI